MIIATVFILSLSSIAFEVLLARLFSISQWNHLSFMVISIALFGFACSGTVLSIIGVKKPGCEKQLLQKGSLLLLMYLYAAGTVFSIIILDAIPLDYFQLPVNHIQILYLFMAYMLPAFPFFICGIVMSAAYITRPESSGHIYFSSMAGSACGALVPVIFLPILSEGWLAMICGIIPIALVPLLLIHAPEKPPAKIIPGKNPYHVHLSVGGLLVICCLVGYGIRISSFDINPSQYKALSQLKTFPGTQILETQTGIRGKFDRVASPYIRYAPGLSLKYTKTLPDQWAIYKDGDSPVMFYDISNETDSDFCRHSLSWAGYLLAGSPDSVLLVINSGGNSIPCALSAGAEKIALLHNTPHIAGMMEKTYSLKAYSASPRNHLSRSAVQYDVIHIENRGVSMPGASALEQDYSFTINSFENYINHLTDNGILILSRRLILPPSDSLRMWASAYTAMRNTGVKNPQAHFALLRNWDSYVFVISKKPIDQLPLLLTFAEKMNFDIIMLPEMTPHITNRFNIFSEPFYHNRLSRLANAYKLGAEDVFFQQNHQDIVPQNDNRPFPYKHLKWLSLFESYRETGGRAYTLLLSGEIVVLTVFAEALAVSIFLLALPLMLFVKGGKHVSLMHSACYFFLIGTGFIFVEMYFIKQCVMIFGNPVISLAFVLPVILMASGAGGRVSMVGSSMLATRMLIPLICLMIAVAYNSERLFDYLAGLTPVLAYGVCGIILTATGFFMGFPFSSGMRWLVKNSRERAYAWAANGCSSVLASVLSAHIALNIGISTLLFSATILYGLAFLISWNFSIKNRN